MNRYRDQLRVAFLGVAVGDALGLPREGLAPKRAKRCHRKEKGTGLDINPPPPDSQPP